MMNNDGSADAIHEIQRCRVSGSRHLVSVLNLGEQHLTGVFPREKSQPVTKGPLEYDAAAGELISRGARLVYPIREGIPIMLPEEARALEG